MAHLARTHSVAGQCSTPDQTSTALPTLTVRHTLPGRTPHQSRRVLHQTSTNLPAQTAWHSPPESAPPTQACPFGTTRAATGRGLMWTQSGPRHTMPTPEMMPSPRSITWQHLMALCSHCRAHPTAFEHLMQCAHNAVQLDMAHRLGSMDGSKRHHTDSGAYSSPGPSHHPKYACTIAHAHACTHARMQTHRKGVAHQLRRRRNVCSGAEEVRQAGARECQREALEHGVHDGQRLGPT